MDSGRRAPRRLYARGPCRSNYADVRDVMIGGESGFLNLGREERLSMRLPNANCIGQMVQSRKCSLRSQTVWAATSMKAPGVTASSMSIMC